MIVIHRIHFLLLILTMLMVISSCFNGVIGGLLPPYNHTVFIASRGTGSLLFSSPYTTELMVQQPMRIGYTYDRWSDPLYFPIINEEYSLKNTTTDSLYVFFDYIEQPGFTSWPAASLVSEYFNYLDDPPDNYYSKYKYHEQHNPEYDDLIEFSPRSNYLYRSNRLQPDSRIQRTVKSSLSEDQFDSLLEYWREWYCPSAPDITQLDGCKGLIIVKPGETIQFPVIQIGGNVEK